MDLKQVNHQQDNSKVIIDYNAADFRDYWQGYCKSLLHEIESDIIRKLLPSTQDWFIDIGCGHGRLSPTYLNKDRRIVMVDYAINHLEMAAREYSADNVFFIAADAYRLPFRDKTFEGGLSVRLFHHISAPEDYWEEFSRIFRPRSYVVFNYMNKRSLLRVLKYGRNSFKRNHEQISGMIYATHPRYISQLAQRAGFDILSRKGTGFLHQVVHDSERIETWLESRPKLLKPISLIERIADTIFGSMGYTLMQYLLLYREAQEEPECAAANCIEDILLCPSCRNTDLRKEQAGFRCIQCDGFYAKKGAIIDFRMSL